MRLSITLDKSDGFRAWKQYSCSDIIEKDASREMGTDHSTEELKVYPTVLVWVLSAATVSRYKVIKVMARGLRFGINCVKSDNFRSNRPENQSGPLFSKTAPRNERATKGGHLPEGGLSAGAGSRESCCGWAHIMSHQIWLEGPLAEGFTQEVQS